MALRDYIIKRTITAIITVFTALTMIFIIFRLIPGDPASILAKDPRLDLETVESIKRLLGLDKPLHEQYIIFITSVFRGEFGVSFFYRLSVWSILLERLANTIRLIGLGAVFSIIIGISLGAIAGWRWGSRYDRVICALSVLSYSMPSFWFGMIMIYLFAVLIPIFPTGGIGRVMFEVDLWTRIAVEIKHLALPLIAYSINFMGQYVLLMRNSLINVITEDYILTAKAKGLRGSEVLRKHAFKNAALPTVTQISINLSNVIIGSVSVETVFAWPGIGRLIYESVLWRDYPLLQGAFTVFTIVVILANYIADLLYIVIDPRVRYQ
ncbi:MAG: ABC transporter permease [Candidatus Methanomethylicia archaeon]